MLLRLPYLALSTAFSFIRLLPMSDRTKDLEILALRHQLSVLQRQIERPQLTCPTGHCSPHCSAASPAHSSASST